MTFLFKKDPNQYETIKKELENLKSDFEAHKRAVDTKYMNWLEEKEIWIKELRDKIAKKVEYLNKKEDNLDMKQVFKNKMLKSMMPRERRTLSDQEKKDLNIT